MKPLNVLNFGAGVQSTTVLLMSLDGILPKLDAVIFADTQYEPESVYRHLAWCVEHAASRGLEISIRSAGNIRDDIIEFWGPRRSAADGKRYASIPAFVRNPDGSSGGLIRRQCTGDYKIDVIERYVREELLGLSKGQRWPKSHVVTNWLGISFDERRRMKVSTRPAVRFFHPLIESPEIDALATSRTLFSSGMTRDDCMRWIASRGYPTPPRSACICCPFRSDREWKALTPSEFEDACKLDEQIRNSPRSSTTDDGRLVGSPFLHRSLVPLRDVVFKDDGRGDWDDECSGICGV